MILAQFARLGFSPDLHLSRHIEIDDLDTVLTVIDQTITRVCRHTQSLDVILHENLVEKVNEKMIYSGYTTWGRRKDGLVILKIVWSEE